MRARLGVIVVAFLAVAAGANASVFVVNDAKRPQLAVDAKGNAKVTWLQGGAAQNVIIQPAGQLSQTARSGRMSRRPRPASVCPTS